MPSWVPAFPSCIFEGRIPPSRWRSPARFDRFLFSPHLLMERRHHQGADASTFILGNGPIGRGLLFGWLVLFIFQRFPSTWESWPLPMCDDQVVKLYPVLQTELKSQFCVFFSLIGYRPLLLAHSETIYLGGKGVKISDHRHTQMQGVSWLFPTHCRRTGCLVGRRVLGLDGGFL